MRRVLAISKATFAIRRISVSVVNHRVDSDPLAVLDPDAAGLAEVGVPQKFPDDEEIDPPDDGGLEGRGVDQVLKDDDRTEVRVEAETGSQAEETPLRPDAVIEGFPFRTPHGAQENGVARKRQFHHLVGKGGAETVVGGAADETFLHLETDAGPLGHDAEDLHRLPDDLGPDAVAGEDRDAIFFHFAIPPDCLRDK